MKALIAFAVAAICANPAITHALTIRVAPADYVYLNENNRLTGIYDVMIHNVAIINDMQENIALDRLEITGMEYGEPSLRDIVQLQHYERRWSSWKTYLDKPGMMDFEDTYFLFSQWLPDNTVLSPNMTLAPGSAVVINTRLLAFSNGHIADSLQVRATGRTEAGQIREATTVIRIVQYEPKNEYTFPVKGRWYVGSASSARSHHRARPAHEFALDLLKISADGSSHRGSGTRPDDYYAFGENVCAVADGVVVRAVNDIPETEMPRAGESRQDFAVRVLDAMWKKDPSGRIAEGNLVIIRHAGGEHSVYVHLKSGSVRVKDGDKVRQGELIGQVGISGDGFQPHLHFQINDGPDPQYSRGLPLYFTNVRPAAFASTIDMSGDRLFMAGEFIETVE